VSDLSIGGCLLRGAGERRVVGDQVEVLLHLPRRNSVGITARVRRVGDQTMGLSFERASPRAEDCIQDLVVETFTTSRAHAQGHVALVIEPDAATRRALLEQLTSLGQPAVGAATALDAVQILMERGELVDFALIEAESLQLPSFELVEFLSQHHPHVRRVLIGDGEGLGQHWLSEASGEVHGMVELPCNNDVLSSMLRRGRVLPTSRLS